MEEQCCPLGLAYYYQEEGLVEELKQSVLYSTLELEAAVISAHEELSRKDDEIFQLRSLIEKIIKEKDYLEAECRQLVLVSNLQRHSSEQLIECCPSSSNTTSNQEDNTNTGLSASDSDDNGDNNVTVAPLALEPQQQRILDAAEKIPIRKPLPEKGKFLKAVMEAGPLLQTLLIAGPLPQWQHPPPQLNSGDIPPVKIFSSVKRISIQDSCLSSPGASSGHSNKRVMINMEGHDLSPHSEHQKVCSPTIIHNPTSIGQL